MALQVIDISTLPVREFGRHATEPRISITEGGQFMFNVIIKDAWEVKAKIVDTGRKDEKGKAIINTTIESGVEKLLVRFDPEARLLVFRGLKRGQSLKGIKEESLLPLKISKDGTQILASGTGILSQLKYDFNTAGNQNFEAKFDDGLKSYVMVLPAETPARRPTVTRKKKPAVAVNGTNGAVTVAAASTPPSEEELLDIQ